MSIFRFAAVVIFLMVLWWVISHSYLIVSTATVVLGLVLLAFVLLIFTEVLIKFRRRKP